MNPETTTTTTTGATAVDTLPLRQIGIIGAGVFLTTVAADFLLWQVDAGLSIGLFFGFLGLLLVCRGPRASGRVWIILTLLAATCVQAAIARSFSNLFAALALILALAGETFHRQLAGLWPRISEVMLGLITAPARWAGLAGTTREAVSTLQSVTPDLRSRLPVVLSVVLPTIALVVIFGWLLAAGNAVFGDLLKRLDQSAWNFWKQLNLTPVRIIWWALVSTLALGLFYQRRAPEHARWWTRTMPRVPRPQQRLAIWQTAMALAAVNLLFGVANTLDAVYLWSSAALPTGVNPSEFLHQGVDNLTTAVLLSAIVIAGIFQQEDAVANHRWLKRLAHLWVLQNFVLIAGVLRRLQFYTHDHGLTEKRVYVGCFLLLVAAGFLLLGWFVEQRKSFNWLLGRNVLAVWLLFFVLQFADVAGLVARYNVDRWKEGAVLDVEHLAHLGPTAWPQLIEVSRSNKQPEARRARELVRFFGLQEKDTDWRGFQWHEFHERRRLQAAIANEP